MSRVSETPRDRGGKTARVMVAASDHDANAGSSRKLRFPEYAHRMIRMKRRPAAVCASRANPRS